MFRGTYLDFKEKADALNAKFHKLDKKYTHFGDTIYELKNSIQY